MANLFITQPPCCSITPYKICKGCGWKTCEGHWFDWHQTAIMDEWHIPTKPDASGNTTGNIGVCIRCKGEEWEVLGE